MHAPQEISEKREKLKEFIHSSVDKSLLQHIVLQNKQYKHYRIFHSNQEWEDCDLEKFYNDQDQIINDLKDIFIHSYTQIMDLLRSNDLQIMNKETTKIVVMNGFFLNSLGSIVFIKGNL
jgi:hypothetical protein